LKRIPLPALSAAALLLFAVAPAIHAQKLSLAPAPPATVEENRKALNSLFAEYWQASLERNPEFASALGDTRYNDRITDYSVKAENAWLEREANFLMQLAAIDTTGLTDQEKISRDLLLREFTDDQEAAQFKEWEMPLTQLGGIYTTYPQLAGELSFTTAKDYDDWIERLHAIPRAFEQETTNMSIGMDDHRVPPRYILEKALEQVKELATQKPDNSPLAAPLKKFPPAVTPAEQERIKTETLDAISKEVLPAYSRLARFLEASYIPAGRTEPGVWALGDGAKYYAFCIRRTTTTNLTAEQIHQIGLDEIKRNEAEMLAIAQKLGFADLKSFRASLKTNPKLHPASPEALMATYRGYIGPMQAKLPQLFGRLPKAPLEVAAEEFAKKAAEEKAKKDAADEVRDAYFNYRKALAQVRNSQLDLDLAERELAIQKINLRDDKATLPDVAEARNKVTGSRVAMREARAFYLISLAALNKAVGISDQFKISGDKIQPEQGK